MNEMPYSLAFDFNVAIPLDVGLPTIRIEDYDKTNNSKVLTRYLDLVDERRENALVGMASFRSNLQNRTTKKSKTKSLMSTTSF